MDELTDQEIDLILGLLAYSAETREETEEDEIVFNDLDAKLFLERNERRLKEGVND